jgi:hypothetical protein
VQAVAGRILRKLYGADAELAHQDPAKLEGRRWRDTHDRAVDLKAVARDLHDDVVGMAFKTGASGRPIMLFAAGHAHSLRRCAVVGFHQH